MPTSAENRLENEPTLVKPTWWQTSVTLAPLGVRRADAVAFGGDGALWFIDESANRLTRMTADEVVKDAMPGRLYKVFEHYKRDEWERYLAAVTDWERDEYLEVLP